MSGLRERVEFARGLQRTLDDALRRDPVGHLVHAGDPQTSRDAIAGLEERGQAQSHRRLVEGHVLLHPGHTAAQVGLYTGLGQTEAARRLHDLKVRGRVRRGEPVTCPLNGTRMSTWHPVNKGMEGR